MNSNNSPSAGGADTGPEPDASESSGIKQSGLPDWMCQAIESLYRFLISNGRDGICPPWYPVLQMARYLSIRPEQLSDFADTTPEDFVDAFRMRATNVPADEIRRFFDIPHNDLLMVSQEWVDRAIIAMNAEQLAMQWAVRRQAALNDKRNEPLLWTPGGR